jgi:hypothetical protein
MRFLFKQNTLNKGKQVYQGNHLEGKRTRESGQEKRQVQWRERKRIPLESISRKIGMMRTYVGSYIPRRGQSGSRKEREAKSYSDNKTHRLGIRFR